MRGIQRFFPTSAMILLMLAVAGVQRGWGAAAPDGGAWRPASGALAESPGAEQVVVMSLAAGDNEQRLVFRFPAPRLDRGADGVFDVTLPSADYTVRPGEPVLPMMAARLAVPQGYEVVSVEVVPEGGRDYVLDGPVRHAQAPYPMSRPEDWQDTPPATDIYTSDDAYPPSLYSPFSVQAKRGVVFADFVLYPVAYYPLSGRLTAYETLTVTMVTRPEGSGSLAPAADAGRWRARFRSPDDARAVTGLLDNPETLEGYLPERSDPGPSTFRLAAGELPCSEADSFQYVIITSMELRDSFQGYNFQSVMELREAQGLSSVIVTVEDILATYSGGEDEAAAIRTFIRDAYDKWGTEYVLLGGDHSIVPVRLLYATVGTSVADMPSDLYYQCLDGSFNSDGDSNWGEPNDGADRMDGRPGEDIDLYAEVAVGRIPVTNDVSLANWARKQVTYERDRLEGVQPYLRGALMIGERLSFGGVAEYAGPMLEEIRTGSTRHGYRTAGFTAAGITTNIVTLYDDATRTWANTELAGLINQNRYSLMNHLGHASYSRAMKFSLFFPASSVAAMLYNDRPGFLYSQGCGIGKFDSYFGSMSQELLVSTPNGLFGGVFNSDFGWGLRNSTDGPSQRYNRAFWHAFFGNLNPVVGLMHQQAHERNASRINEVAMRWSYYTSNLLGDPAQWLFGVAPQVRLDRRAYRSDASATVAVLWPLAGEAIGEVEVLLELVAEDGVTVTGVTNLLCRRSGPAGTTGSFASDPVALADLGAVNGGRVNVSVELVMGAGLATYTDQALIDDDPPVILNLRVAAVDELWMDVAWDGDEPVTGAVRAGTVLPLTDAWTAGPSDLSTNVTIRLTGLTPYTRYYIGIRAEDAAGNVTFAPADVFSTDGPDYLAGSTIGRETVVRYDWNRDRQGWTVTNLLGGTCWEYGEPVAYGPQGAGRCWGTVLDGRYPDGANARLSSPPFAVRSSPLIRFRHWHDIQYSPAMDGVLASPSPHGDYGQIEVLSSGVWHNVTMNTDVAAGSPFITGRSGGWQDVRLLLPPAFENQTLALRFRFVSDEQRFLDGNPAGWYVDDVIVTDVPGSGLGINLVEVDDTEGGGGLSGFAGLEGDGDSLAEPGETVALRPQLHNYGTVTAGPLTGSFVVLVAGNPSALAELVEGSPAPVAYGPVDPMESVPAQAWKRLRLSPALEPGTVVTLLQTVTNAAGQIFESRHDLVVDVFATISGTVTEAGTGDPVALARVEAVRDGEVRLLAVSGADGRFALNGASTGAVYTVTASKAGVYTPVSRQVQAPTSDVVFVLGRSEASVIPENLSFSVAVGGVETQSLTVANAAGATAPLLVALEEVDYGAGLTGWLAMTPVSFTVAPGASQVVEVTADASVLGVGHYTAVLVLTTDGPGAERIEIPVELEVRQQPVLAYGGLVIQDDDDGDGRWEEGESCGMRIYLNNQSGISDARALQGILEPLHPNVTLTGSADIAWPYIPESASRLSEDAVGLTLAPGLAPGEALPFRLTVTYDGDQTNIFEFSYTPLAFHSVSGLVEVTLWAADPANTLVLPLHRAVVVAEDSAGFRYTSSQTDTNGMYTIEGVPAGDLWFTVIPPATNPCVAPAGQNVYLDAPMELNFMLTNYGEGAPHLALVDVLVDDSVLGDGDGMIDPGERFSLRVRIRNTGAGSVQAATGLLSTADMGALGPFMTVDDAASDWPLMIWSQMTASMGTFEVVVDAGAVAGDRQRFLLEVSERRNPENPDDPEAPALFWTWPIDFTLTVDPRYSVSGMVTYADSALNTPEHLAGIRVLAEYGGQSGTVLTGPDGSYRINQIIPGSAVTLRVDVPEGFRAEPPIRAIASLDADAGGLDFVLETISLRVTPESLAVTLREGATTNKVLTLANDGSAPVTADLDVVYQRGIFDVVPPATDPLAAVLAGLGEEEWSRLSADDYAEGELEVRFADGVGWMERQEILDRHGLRALFHLSLVPACVAVPADSTSLSGSGPAALAPLALALGADPRILYVQPAAKVQMQDLALPNDPLLDAQYGLHNTRQTGGTLGADINVEPVWAKGITGSRGIIVAICDTGMQLTHEDLAANLWRNPLEQPGDANRDGYPGLRNVDDDGDAAQSLYHFNTVTGVRQGPETVDPRFEPSIWADVRSLLPVPGKQSTYAWQDGANDIPDFFEPYLLGIPVTAELLAQPSWAWAAWASELVPGLPDVNGDGVLDIHDLLADPRFADSNGDGIPDLFADSTGNGIPDIFGDEDGDGIINETGVDFRDQDVMTADYRGSGRPLVIQKMVFLPWMGGGRFRVLAEQWDLNAMPRAAADDDENGYADDINGWNFGSWNNNVRDADRIGGHGTHVAGTIGAVGNNGLGVAGVNWTVSLMPLPVVDDFVRFTTFGRIAKAIEYALRQGAHVSNHSWGGSQTAGVMYEVMKRAERDYNHLFVIAAGNAGNDLDKTRLYPAYFSTVLNNVITVAAADHDGQLASFSCWGQESVQIAAPGVDILSTMQLQVVPIAEGDEDDGGGLYYGYKSGTSMAAPHVSGAAALLWASAPGTRYEAIKDALLRGARPDPNLQGWVRTGGHLDVGRALSALGREWLVLSTNQVQLAEGESSEVVAAFNPGLDAPAGQFEAAITVTYDAGQLRIPVTLTVVEQPVARLAAVRVVSDSDSDGYAEPGETVEFRIALHNAGGGTFSGLAGVLTALTPGVGVLAGSAAWDYLYSGDTGESLTAFRVVLPVPVADPVVFELTLTAEDASAQVLEVTLPSVLRHTIRGRVATAGGAGVADVLVECRGAAGGMTLTDAAGDYTLHGLEDGNYTLRALPAAHARSADLAVEVAGRDFDDANLAVGSPDLTFSAVRLEAAVPTGMSGMQTVTVVNASAEAYAFEAEVMPRRRIGLFADGTGLAVLAEPLRRMGFVVDLFTNNFGIVHYLDPATAQEMVRPEVRYTQDDANLFACDLVIADLNGPRDGGRVFTDAEQDAFERYLERGGRVIFTGGNPLTRPDNEGVAALCGVGLGRDTAAAGEPVAAADWNGRFVQLAAGDRIAGAALVYDLAVPEVGTTVLFTAGAAAKLTRRAAGTGVVWLWGGNPSAADWTGEGVWLDILRDILRETFLQPAAAQTQVAWLQVSPVSGVAAGGAVNLVISLDANRLAPGTYHATVALLGLDRGEEVYAVPLTLAVEPYSLRVTATNLHAVTDWRGQPLRGDGGPASALYQVIYAGADGNPNPPATNAAGEVTGAPTGDDLLLAVFPTREAFGRFGGGAGIPADGGRFDGVFSVPLSAGTENAVVYVRAWDAASFASALAYGDSVVRHTLAFTSGETADFGSWQVTNVINFSRDSNTNSLPDGWIMKYRPDLDPRAVPGPLGSSYQSLGITDIPRKLPGDAAPKPYRAVLSMPSGAFVYALDQANNRIVITPVADPGSKVFFGEPGSGAAQFGRPEGMADDPRSGQYRLAVADTDNHRVQLFTYDPGTGALAFERAFGSYGSGTNQLNRPAAVAFDNTGRVFVADKLNGRVAIFRVSDGAWLGSFTGTGSYVMNAPQGLCVDSDAADGGVWVCDTANNRMVLYTTAGVFKRSFGGQGSAAGKFMTPVDVQIWRHRYVDPVSGIARIVRRLCVADKVNNRIQVFRTDGTHLISVGTGGTLPGELRLPHGVHPLADRPELLVADTDNGRLQRFTLTLDADMDGMNDFWEDINGLYSAVNDAYGDLDGDGLFNIAESLIQTDPSNADTNGDGVSDGDSVQAGEDPRQTGIAVSGFTLSASPAMVPAGGLVTLTLVCSQPPATDEPVVLTLTGGVSETLTMTRQSANTYVAAYLTAPRASGVVNAGVQGDALMPAEDTADSGYQRSGLFTIYFPPFRITSAGRTPVRLTWESVAGGVYQIETNATLASSGWGVFTNVVATGAPESTVELAPPPAARFFRVKRVQE